MSSGYFVLMNIHSKRQKVRPMAKPTTVRRVQARDSWVMVEKKLARAPSPKLKT